MNDHLFIIFCIYFTIRFEDRRAKVCKELKKLTDCLCELNTIEKQLLEELNSTTINEVEKFNLFIDKFSHFINELSKNREDLSTIITRTFIEPLKKFQNALNEMKNAIKRYEQLIIENNKLIQKVAKYKDMERTSSVIVKLNDYQSKLTQNQSDVKTLKNLLEQELPMLLQRRIDYLQPSLAAFISSEILYSGNNLSALKEMEQVSSQLTDTERSEMQNKLFDSIDSLSIVTS